MIDAFSGVRSYSLIPLAIIVGGYLSFLKYSNFQERILDIGYWSLLLVYIVVSFIVTQKKLKKLDLPKAYLNQFNASRVIQYLGLGVLIATLFQDAL